MPPPRQKYFAWLFTLLVLLDLLVANLDVSAYRFVTKPLILSSLLVYFGVHGRSLPRAIYAFMLLALSLSLLGDVFLIFESSTGVYFMLGLIAFLLAHLCYCVVFVKQWKGRPDRKFIRFALLLLAYGTIMFLFLKDDTGDLTLPVGIYILIILCMALAAYGRKEAGDTLSSDQVLLGALLFIASDSFLAINKFSVALPYSNLLVMGTYAAAQFLIVRGILDRDII